MDNKLVKQFVELTKQKKKAEQDLKMIKEQIQGLQDQFLKELEKAGVQSMTVGGFTVYIERKLWAGAVDGDKGRMIKALKRARLKYLVTESVNTHSLSAYFRGLEEAKRKPPTSLEGAVQTHEVFTVKARKASS